jgi:hypothetical protein
MQTFVELQPFVGLRGGEHESLIQGNSFLTSTTLIAKMTTGVIDQNAPHKLGSYSKKVGPALPIGRALLPEFQVSLVNQGGSLQGTVGAFAPHVTPGQLPQFVIDQRDERGCSTFVPLGQLRKEEGHIPWC